MKGLKFIIYLSIAFLLVTLNSCEKKKIGPQSVEDESYSPFAFTTGVLIANEGNFGSSTASLSAYSPSAESVANNVITNSGGQFAMDVMQSITELNDQFYLIGNNSSKIVAINKETFVPENVIELPNRSPRYMVVGNNGQSFISNFAINPNGAPVYIDVMDNASQTIVNSINVGSWTEEMLVKDSLVYVCDMGSDRVRVYDDTEHNEVKVYDLGIEPISIVEDENGHIWVLCTGGFEEELATLWKINPLTDELTTLEFEVLQDYPTDLKINGEGDELYFLNNGVHKLSISATELPTQSFVSEEEGINFYALDVDPFNGQIYVSDAKDFQVDGDVYRYSPSGELIDEFSAGIIPGYFHFY